MMDGRSTVYNNITDSDKLKQVNPENLQLEEDFLEYLESVDRSKGTIKQYKANLHIFWCWNLEFNKNKFFVDLTKRELVKFQNHALNIWQWSPRRIRVVKATISSLSNFIESILDDEFEDYRPIVRKIESPSNEAVREKSVFTKEELFRQIWDMESVGDIATVTVHIKKIREKIEFNTAKPQYIETIWGVGYRFKV